MSCVHNATLKLSISTINSCWKCFNVSWVHLNTPFFQLLSRFDSRIANGNEFVAFNVFIKGGHKIKRKKTRLVKSCLVAQQTNHAYCTGPSRAAITQIWLGIGRHANLISLRRHRYKGELLLLLLWRNNIKNAHKKVWLSKTYWCIFFGYLQREQENKKR